MFGIVRRAVARSLWFFFLPGFIAAAVQRKSLEGSALRGGSGATGDLAAWGGSSEEEAEAGAGKKRIRKDKKRY